DHHPELTKEQATKRVEDFMWTPTYPKLRSSR
ncbi:MAG: hypothetical protein KDD46_02050, partial [Bdellovibrionales bacterium]|nr:hypothetical protein [Bdellovibrionales bacterium]